MAYQVNEALGVMRVTVPSQKNWLVTGLFKRQGWAILLSGVIMLAVAGVFAILLALFGLAWWADQSMAINKSASSLMGIMVSGLFIWGLCLVLRDLAWAIGGEEIWEIDDTYLKISRHVSVGKQRLQVTWPRQYALHNIRELSIGSGTGILGRIRLIYQAGRWGRLVRFGTDLDFEEAHTLMEMLSRRYSKFATIYDGSRRAMRA